ncbi:MAG: site-specific integrase [Planctomycetota bacterium]
MATIYRKTHTKPLPKGAKISTRNDQTVARWTDGRGRTQTAQVSVDGKRIVLESGVWHARYRAADGTERRESTGCRDEQMARQYLASLLVQIEKVRSGVLTPEESQTARHSEKPVAAHFAEYAEYLKAKTVRGRRVSADHRYNVAKQLAHIARECGFKRIGDINRQRMIRWMNTQADENRIGGRTVNTYRAAVVAFCHWAVANNRLTNNPLEGLAKADESNIRRQRRALTIEEVIALLEASRARPLRDALMIRRGDMKGELAAAVTDAERLYLERIGRERAMIYKVLIYTGLRKGELGSLTVGAVHLDVERGYLELAAKSSKSGKAAQICLRKDLAEDLAEHLADKLHEYCRRTLVDGRSEIPAALPPGMKLFDMPGDFIRVFDRDLVAAGLARQVQDPKTGRMRIDKTDSQGRTLDIHCLRHTFATLLSKANVSPRMAQELLRHSDIRLTMNTYTHLQLIDTAKAVEALPGFENSTHADQRQRKTGTYDGRSGLENGAENGAVFGAVRQEDRGNPGQSLTNVHDRPRPSEAQNPLRNKDKKRPLSSTDKGRQTAGEGSRTLNNQLGRQKVSTLYH